MYVEFVFLKFKFPLNAYQPQNIEASLVRSARFMRPTSSNTWTNYICISWNAAGI